MELREVIDAIRAWERLTLGKSGRRHYSLCAQCMHPLFEHSPLSDLAVDRFRRRPCTACRCANFGRLWAVALGFRK